MYHTRKIFCLQLTRATEEVIGLEPIAKQNDRRVMECAGGLAPREELASIHHSEVYHCTSSKGFGAEVRVRKSTVWMSLG
jgi:hypothetical protein